MIRYVFTLDLNTGIKAEVIYAYSIAAAVEKLLSMEGCKEYNILSILIKE